MDREKMVKQASRGLAAQEINKYSYESATNSYLTIQINN